MAEKASNSMQWEAFLRPPQLAKIFTALFALGSFISLEIAIGSLNVPGRDSTHTFHPIVTFVTFAVMTALVILAFFFFWPYIMDPRKAFLVEIAFDVVLTIGLLVTTVLITVARATTPIVYRSCENYFMLTFCNAHLAATILSYFALIFAVINLVVAITYCVRNKEVYDW